MQPLLTSAQMRTADAYTIAQQKISSTDLMETAAMAFVKAFVKEVKPSTSVAIFCGPGNNGGDGLAIARLLHAKGYNRLHVWVTAFSETYSPDHEVNLKRLKKTGIPCRFIPNGRLAEEVAEADVLIDALLGSGLKRPLSGPFLSVVKAINKLNKPVYAVDIPTGMPAEGPIPGRTVFLKAYKVFCFQLPKINFFFPESAAALSAFETLEIGLDKKFIARQESTFKLVQKEDVVAIYKPRQRFSHKGSFGHALLVAGADATMGAALLTAKACLYTGAGLTTACIPASGLTALNTALPEVMYLPGTAAAIKKGAAKYNTIGIGPGLSTSPGALKLLKAAIALKKPMVLDADALNLLSENKNLLNALPEGSILTPHVKEFDRLFGVQPHWWGRVAEASKMAMERQLVIVLKNQYTFIMVPSGAVFINTTGNPAMAGGGMGDVLTGVITALLAQGYSAADAAVLGCYLHGKAGDLLAKEMAVVPASCVAKKISAVLKRIAVKKGKTEKG